MKESYRLRICFGIVALLLLAAPAWGAQDLGGSVLRDYPAALTLPRGRLELDLDYLAMPSDLDPFDFTEGDSAAPAIRLGEMSGLRLMADYGLLRRTTLMVRLQYRDLEFGLGSPGIKSLDVGFRQNLIDKRDPSIPKVAVDVGGRWNGADDLAFDGALGAAGPGRFAMNDASDWTAWTRLTTGWIWGWFFPNLFAEYGYTRIQGDGTWTAAGSEGAAGVPVAMDRSEHYLKAGASLWIKFPYRALLHLEYDFVYLFRDEGLSYMQYNNVAKLDVNFYVTPSFIVNVGGAYLQRQFNGEIPLLYNAYTQTAFHRDYAYYYAGVTYLFDF